MCRGNESNQLESAECGGGKIKSGALEKNIPVSNVHLRAAVITREFIFSVISRKEVERKVHNEIRRGKKKHTHTLTLMPSFLDH